MDPIRKQELKRQAGRRLAEQRQRAGHLRGRVLAISLACFALLWGIVFVQMATGNDPALSGKKVAKTQATASTRREVETTDPREVETEQGAANELAREEEAAAEAEVEGTEVGPASPEVEEVETVEAEPEVEAVETEPLVTSQS
ncbi:MAG: hypothetical protein JSU06_08820 [Actinobacteria bacterium]|nr:hypothetical protein [Actinomycetota bacterium]